jgi:hypothetical protein
MVVEPVLDVNFLPSGHCKQVNWNACGWNVPVGQGKQIFVAGSNCLPASQGPEKIQ